MGPAPSVTAARPATARRAAEPLRRPGRRRRRALRVAVVVASATAVLVAGVAVYVRYRIGEIKALPCPACVPAHPGQPFNVLLLGSDTDYAASSVHGGSPAAEGAWSDAIKVLRVDPRTGTARLLSIPRDTYVPQPGPTGGAAPPVGVKLGFLLSQGPDAVARALMGSFGIAVSHFVVFDFSSVVQLVDTVGGISLDFPYPVRDDDRGVNHAGLSIPKAGCRTLSGTQALAVARSRYYQYETGPHRWVSDPSGDLGRIGRQDAVIEALASRVRRTYDPLSVNALLSSAVHDVTIDDRLSFPAMVSLVRRYDALASGRIETVELPTTAEYAPASGAVQVVEEPGALRALAGFLGRPPLPVAHAPLDGAGLPVVARAASDALVAGGPGGAAPAGTPPFDPVPC